MIEREIKFPVEGMTLRDWFAGQALAGWSISSTYSSYEDVARNCFIIADAFIKERNK